MTELLHGMDWTTFTALAGLLTVYSGIVLWAVRVLLNKQSEDLKDKNDDQDNEIDQMRKELADHKVEVAKHYIRREDALVFFARFEQKLDAVWNFLHERFTSNGSR